MALVIPSPYSLSTRCIVLLCHFMLFSLIYISTNSYAEYQGVEQSIITSLDQKIPFIPAMIIPYLSSFFFFVLAFYYVNTSNKFHQLNQNIILATLIAGWIFYLFPLSFGHTDYVIDYPWRMGFNLLQSVDKPYNQTPSLHVIYGLLLWAALKDLFSKFIYCFITIYIALMLLSTLFVYQHHLIDVMSGFVVTLAILFFSQRYLIPYPVLIYFTLASTCLLLGLMSIDVSLFLFLMLGYLSVNFSLIAIAYITKNPNILGKNEQGKLNTISVIFLMPYIVSYWLMAKKHNKRYKGKSLSILPWLEVGARLELLKPSEPYTHIIDLSAELPRLNAINVPSSSQNVNYLSFPLLDLQPITLNQAIEFCQVVDAINAKALIEKTTVLLYVHCTMGISRSYAMAASYLVWSGQSSPAEIKKKLLSYNKDIILRDHYLPDTLLINLAESPAQTATSVIIQPSLFKTNKKEETS